MKPLFLWIIIAFCFFFLVYLFPYFPAHRDLLWYVYPLKHYSVSQITHGYCPLFNPYNGGGERWWANPQIGLLYPLSYLFLLPPAPAIWLYILIHHLIFGLGWYRWLRSYVSKPTAQFVALALALSGPFLSSWDLSFALATLSFWPWCLSAGREKRTYPLILFLALSFFGGEPFVALIIWLSTCIYLLTQKWQIKKIILVFFGAFLITSPVLVPFTNFFLHSNRFSGLQQIFALKWSAKLIDFLEMLFGQAWGAYGADSQSLAQQGFLPLTYLGMFFVLLSLYGAITGSYKNRLVFLLILFSMGISLGNTTPFYHLLKPLYLAIRYPSRCLWFILPGMGYLACYALDKMKNKNILLFAGLGTYVICYIFIKPLYLSRFLLHAFAFLLIIAFIKKNQRIAITILSLDLLLPMVFLKPLANQYGLHLYSPYADPSGLPTRSIIRLDSKKMMEGYAFQIKDYAFVSNRFYRMLAGYCNLLFPTSITTGSAPLILKRTYKPPFLTAGVVGQLSLEAWGITYRAEPNPLPFLYGLDTPLTIHHEAFHKGRFHWKVSNPKKQFVVTGLLYDPHLRVRIDNQEIPPEIILEQLGFPLPLGEHTLEIYYKEPFLLPLLILGFLATLGLMIKWMEDVAFKTHHHHPELSEAS